jgi:hypothetical protein
MMTCYISSDIHAQEYSRRKNVIVVLVPKKTTKVQDSWKMLLSIDVSAIPEET